MFHSSYFDSWKVTCFGCFNVLLKNKLVISKNGTKILNFYLQNKDIFTI
jgi:hypothetical protein